MLGFETTAAVRHCYVSSSAARQHSLLDKNDFLSQSIECDDTCTDVQKMVCEYAANRWRNAFILLVVFVKKIFSP